MNHIDWQIQERTGLDWTGKDWRGMECVALLRFSLLLGFCAIAIKISISEAKTPLKLLTIFSNWCFMATTLIVLMNILG